MTLKEFRAQFPALERPVGGKRLIYLDSACTALKSRPMVQAMNDFYLNSGACSGKRSVHKLSQQAEDLVWRCRETVMRFLGAQSANEIVFTSGTTEAFNLLARSFPFAPGKNEVVLTDLEHNAVLLPLLEQARTKKIKLKIVPSHDGVLDLNRLENAVTDRTALVAITHASNVYGGVLPVGQAARIAHAKGAAIAIDDAQYVSSHEENVSASNVDFAAFSAHKLGGPFGIGVLYGKERWLNRLNNFKVGGGTLKTLENPGSALPKPVYLDAPLRFEAGVQNYAGMAGLEAAIQLIESLGHPVIRKHMENLVGHLLKGLEGSPEILVLGKPENLRQGSLVSFSFENPSVQAADFNLFLIHELKGCTAALRTGEHCAHLLHGRRGLKETVRVSFFAYNTAREVDMFLDGLRAFAGSVQKEKPPQRLVYHA